MREDKWLLRKISGSRAKYTHKPNYSESRNSRKANVEDLPKRESIGKGHTYLDTTLVKRWLFRQVGNDFDGVYSEFLKRIQAKYLKKYRNCIFNYVDKKEDVLLDRDGRNRYASIKFFIDPATNILCRYPDVPRDRKKILQSKFGSFYYQLLRHRWMLSRRLDFAEIMVNNPGDKWEDFDIQQVEFYLARFSVLKRKAYAALDAKFRETGYGLTVNNDKFLKGLYFEDSNDLDKFSFSIEVAKIDGAWAVKFDKLQVVGVESSIE